MRLKLGLDAPAFDTTLAMPAPQHVGRYDTLAPARFHFDASAMPGLRVVMDAELLDMPQPLADARLRQQIDARCEALGRRVPTGEKGWGEFVKMMLSESQGTLLTLEDLAWRVNVSGSTIDRHLKKEKLRFGSWHSRCASSAPANCCASPAHRCSALRLAWAFPSPPTSAVHFAARWA